MVRGRPSEARAQLLTLLLLGATALLCMDLGPVEALMADYLGLPARAKAAPEAPLAPMLATRDRADFERRADADPGTKAPTLISLDHAAQALVLTPFQQEAWVRTLAGVARVPGGDRDDPTDAVRELLRRTLDPDQQALFDVHDVRSLLAGAVIALPRPAPPVRLLRVDS